MTLRGAWLAIVLTAGVVAPATPQSSQPRSPTESIVATLTKMLDDDWHPLLNDPLWLDLTPRLEAEIAAQAQGRVSALARRAAARVDISADPVVSTLGHSSGFQVDLRPWFELSTPMPYFVEVHAVLDAGQPVIIAAGFSGARCGARTIDILWPRPITFGFQRVSLTVNIAYLQGGSTVSGRSCAFSTWGMAPRDWPRLDRARVLDVEQRELPSIAFALFDQRRHVWSPYEADGVWLGDEELAPDYDVFTLAAQRVPVGLLDPRLDATPLAQWLNTIVPLREAALYSPGQIEWLTGFCDEDEALWWHPMAWDPEHQPRYWRASTAARRKRREFCATALAQLPAGHGVMGVRVVVATLLEAENEWQLVAPRLYEAFLDGSSNSLAVNALGDLSIALNVPEESWPRADISVYASDVVIDPPAPLPGQSATVRVTIRNLGDRDVRYVHGDVMILPFGESKPIVQEFVADLPWGAVLTVERAVTLSSGGADVAVVVSTVPSEGRDDNGWRRFPLSDWNPMDNAVETSVGRRSRF